MSDARTLPRFDHPPVNEVIFSLQFEQLRGLTPVHLGLWWDRAERRSKYPLCEQQPRLVPAVEEFDALPGSFSIEFGTQPPAPAFWFLTSDRSEESREP